MVLEENGEDKMVRESNYELVLEGIGEKRNNVLRRKASWIDDILREITSFMLPLKDR